MCLSMLAKTYFKAGLNNRSIVEGSISDFTPQTMSKTKCHQCRTSNPRLLLIIRMSNWILALNGRTVTCHYPETVSFSVAPGMMMVKHVPFPRRLSTSIRPLWYWTICLTMANPSPVPPWSRLLPLSTR